MLSTVTFQQQLVIGQVKDMKDFEKSRQFGGINE